MPRLLQWLSKLEICLQLNEQTDALTHMQMFLHQGSNRQPLDNKANAVTVRYADVAGVII